MGRESWATRVGVILAVTGSAVGLGNFLRFPGLAAQYEGGAFMIPYFIAFVLVGLPIAWVEWTLGRYGGSRGYNSMPGIFRVICGKDRASYFGVIGLIVPVMIYMYYVYIEAWCLGYAMYFLSGTMNMGSERETYSSFFYTFIGIDEDGAVFGESWQQSVLPFLLVCFIINFMLIWRGISRGIEMFCRIAMPMLLIIALIVLVRVLTLPGVTGGLSMTWSPYVPVSYLAAGNEAVEALGATSDHAMNMDALVDGTAHVPTLEAFEEAAAAADWQPANAQRPEGVWNHADTSLQLQWHADTQTASLAQRPFWLRLLNPDMWLAAAGQIFFSLSVGFGVIITYSSYMKRRDDVALSSLTAASGNGFCEVCLGGMITIPAAFLLLGAVGVNDAAGSLFNLGFITLPMVFAEMWLGQLFGFLFFFLLFLAAVTSSLSMLQPAIAFLEEALGIKRRASVAILGLMTLFGTFFVVFFSKDAKALDTIDFWIGTFAIFVLATIQVILFGWVLGMKKGMEELDRGSEIRVPRFFGFIIKYVSPVFLLLIFGAWVYHNFIGPALVASETPARIKDLTENTVAQLSVGFIVVLVVFFCLLIGEARRRWRRMDDEAEKAGAA